MTRRRQPYRGALAVLVTCLVFLAAYTVAARQAGGQPDIVQAAGSTSVDVTAATGFKFVPNGFNDVGTNTTVTVKFVNGDTLTHTFSIWGREGVVIPSSTSAGDLSTLFTQYPPLVSIVLDGGGQNTTTFPAPPTGWYEFVCLEEGHFGQGMYGFIAFGQPLPSNLTVTTPDEGPGTAVFIIIGTIVALTVIAVVLGFVVGRRRGSTDEMPPERLGYPEPEAPPSPLPPPGAGPPGH